jgi:hypothetical protein
VDAANPVADQLAENQKIQGGSDCWRQQRLRPDSDKTVDFFADNGF